jgi:Domain of unknown function (DUF1814).
MDTARRAFKIRAAVYIQGLPFICKGGTALMLLLNFAKRLSIDIDILD